MGVTKTPSSLALDRLVWKQFADDDEEEKRVDTLIRAECKRREQTDPPDHLTETQKKYWAYYHPVKRDLFPDEYDESDELCRKHIEWRDNQIALGLSTEYVDPKFRKAEPEKVEWTPPPVQRVEPVEMDPARKQELLLSRWSM